MAIGLRIAQGRRARRTVYLLWVLTVLLFSALPAIGAEGLSISRITSSSSSLPLPIVFLFQWCLDRLLVRRAILQLLKDEKPGKGQLGKHRIVLSEDGVAESTAVGESRTSWAGVDRVEQNPDYIFIYTSPAAAHLIPKRAFRNLQEAEAFYQLAGPERGGRGMTAPAAGPLPRGAAAPPPHQRDLRRAGRRGARRLRHPPLRPHLSAGRRCGRRAGARRRLVVDIPGGLDGWLDRAFHLLPTMWSAVRRSDVDMPWDFLAGLFVLPGFITMVLLWAIVRLTFRRTGVGGVLRRMEARPPRSGDLAEQRLVNLVQEVAVATAVPPPRVLLIDSEVANVGAAGLTMDDATVVVTRGFVEKLPRDSQQAVIAHVMASVGNGDLTLAAEIMTLIQAWGLVSLVLEAPFLPATRASLRLVSRTAIETLRGRADAASRELAVDTLIAGAGWENLDSDELERLPDAHPLVLLFGYLPLLLTIAPAAIAAKAIIWLTLMLTGPFVAVLWRTRRRLADATAVELTRHPRRCIRRFGRSRASI